MKKFTKYIIQLPLDWKLFLLSGLMILGIFIFPDDYGFETLFITYIIFIFISISITSFYVTYVRDSKYNFFRNISSLKQLIFTILGYLLFCLIVSYLLAITELFLFLL